MSYIFLSYNLNERTPAYGGGESLRVEQIKSMELGDTCNTQFWYLPNHLGTHIDAPKHFDRSGFSIDIFNADFWVSKNPFWIEIKKIKEKEIITSKHIDNIDIPNDTDLLLIKTGFAEWRGHECYYKRNPGFAPEVADYLRGRLYSLKMIGFDVISLSSFAARDLGRKAHRAFLDHDRPILPIEDMELSALQAEVAIEKVFVIPLRVQGADASPCMVLGEIRNKMG